MVLATVAIVPQFLHGEDLHVGAATVDITPPVGYRLSGYFRERLSTGTHDPLLAKALYLKQGEIEAALVFCDIIGVSLDVSQRARQRAAEATGIASENILIAATHSHTGPLYFGALREHFHFQAIVAEGRDKAEAVNYADALVKQCVTAIQDAKAYGATSVLLVPAVVNQDVNYRQAWDRSQAAIRKAIPLAGDLGIRILLENVWNDFLTDAGETAKYIDQLDSDVVGAYFDVGNAVRYAPPADWIRVLGKRIVKLDIKEFSLSKVKATGKQYAGFEVPLLEGDCNWPAVLDELRSIGFHGWGTAEIPGGGEERLREIAVRMDRIFAS